MSCNTTNSGPFLHRLWKGVLCEKVKEEKITCAKALVKTLREFKVDEDEIVTRLMKEFSMRNLRIRLERGRLFGGGKPAY